MQLAGQQAGHESGPIGCRQYIDGLCCQCLDNCFPCLSQIADNTLSRHVYASSITTSHDMLCRVILTSSDATTKCHAAMAHKLCRDDS